MSFRVKPDDEATPATGFRPYYTGSAWEQGALLIVHSDGTFKEAGADPSAIAAVAEHAVGTGSGAEYPIGYKEFPPLSAIGTILKPGMHLICEYTGAMGTVGTAYGVVRDADSKWKLDFGETSTVQFRLVKNLNVAPLAVPLVEVVVITSVIQAA